VTTRYDYVVIGAGSAGSVLAARLAGAGRRVLLLEAGAGRGRSLLHRLPFAFPKLWFRPDTSWNLRTEPEPCMADRSLPIPRGRGLGGSSAINGMIYNRASAWDWDRWGEIVSPDWRFEAMLPWFKRVEAHHRGSSALHGGEGLVLIHPLPSPSPLSRTVLGAACAMGYPVTEDFAGAEPEGFGVPDFTIDRRARRCSASDAYLRRPPTTLTIERGATVSRILIEAGRAVGVEYERNGECRAAHADAEVALCGGALASPQILMLSGIGPACVLRRAGVSCAVDRAEVGRNLQDHIGGAFEVESADPRTFERTLRLDRFAVATAQWALGLGGPLGAPPVIAMGIVRSMQGSPAPDLRLLISGVSMSSRPWFPKLRPGRGPAMMVGFSICYPRSRGFVEIRSADPAAPPAFRYNGLCEREDVDDLARAYRMTRELLDEGAMRSLVRALPAGLPDPHDAGAVEAWLRRASMITHHPVGSCRMGADADAVVDPRCRVNGVGNLRVVDASIFPQQIGGNPNVPIMAIAEKIAADMLAGE